MPATCWDCGETGHVVADCPNAVFTGTPDGKPPWCGICDERTRLIGHDTVSRCQQCHPHRRQQLRQHRKCPRCHMTIYEWDTAADCTGHAAPHAPDRRPEREHIRQITGAA